MTPTCRLEQEHERILLLLDVLEALARRALAGERPHDEAAEALDLLRTFADGAHHGKEERHLFPAMNAAGMPRHAGPVAVMLLEHDAGRDELTRMGSGLALLRKGATDGARRFAQAAARYVELMREHIIKEEEVLFPMACDLLERGDLLEAAYAEVDANALGPDGYAPTLARIDALVAATLPGRAPRPLDPDHSRAL